MRKTICRNKRPRRKTLKGGASGKLASNLGTAGLTRYTNHIYILLRFYIKPNIYSISYIGSGDNGFVVKIDYTPFDSRIKIVNAYKILLNKVNPSSNHDAWLQDVRKKLSTEYNNIQRLASCTSSGGTSTKPIGIIQTSGYLVFDMIERRITGFDSSGPLDSIIEQPMHENYKVAYAEGKKSPSAGAPLNFEGFGVLIMEYVQYKLVNIATHLAPMSFRTRVKTLLKLFWGYLYGISCINNMNMIHTDIKIDNLMYNIEESNFKAKIVDFANLKSVTRNTKFTSDSTLGIVAHAEMKGALEQSQKNLEVDKTAGPRFTPGISAQDKTTIQTRASELRENIKKRYDLYCLAVTFHYLMCVKGSPLKHLLAADQTEDDEGRVYKTFTDLLNEFVTFELDSGKAGMKPGPGITKIVKLKDNDTVLAIIIRLISALA